MRCMLGAGRGRVYASHAPDRSNARPIRATLLDAASPLG
jgi:hypothetical protein